MKVLVEIVRFQIDDDGWMVGIRSDGHTVAVQGPFQLDVAEMVCAELERRAYAAQDDKAMKS
jgi:hypothetical protein